MNTVERVWIFTGGDFSKDHLSAVTIDSDEFIVCVDSGVSGCLSAGLKPDLLVGDFDSASSQALQDARLQDVPRYEFPQKKDASDLELALEIVAERNPTLVTVLGVSGGRTDHMLFNWQLIASKPWNFDRQLIDETTHAYVIEGHRELVIDSECGTQISLLAVNSCWGVTTTGLHYPLVEASIEPGSTLGLSNIVEAKSFSVKVVTGTLLVMVQRSDRPVY